jgi:hypothetical protein
MPLAETPWAYRRRFTNVGCFHTASYLKSNISSGWTTLVDWTNAADDETVRAVPIAVTETWKQQSKQRGLDIPFIFTNDGSRDQNPIASYGAVNVQKLKKIAEKYDPGKVFQNQQNGGFLLKDT